MSDRSVWKTPYSGACKPGMKSRGMRDPTPKLCLEGNTKQIPSMYLSCINVTADNPAYSSVDDILYDKNMTKLICVPSVMNGKFVVPSSVTNIGRNAFGGCKNLDVVIDNSRENVKVGEDAFYGCKSVKFLK